MVEVAKNALGPLFLENGSRCKGCDSILDAGVRHESAVEESPQHSLPLPCSAAPDTQVSVIAEAFLAWQSRKHRGRGQSSDKSP